MLVLHGMTFVDTEYNMASVKYLEGRFLKKTCSLSGLTPGQRDSLDTPHFDPFISQRNVFISFLKWKKKKSFLCVTLGTIWQIKSIYPTL